MTEKLLSIGEIAGIVGTTSQGVSYFLSGLADRPDLTEDLMVIGDRSMYHLCKMSRKDAEEFIRRIREHWTEELKPSRLVC